MNNTEIVEFEPDTPESEQPRELVPAQNTDLYVPYTHSCVAVDSFKARMVVANAMQNAKSLSDLYKEHPDYVISVIGFFCSPGVRRARSNDQVDKPCTNTTLICEDGNAYFTQSEGVRRSIESYAAVPLFDGVNAVPLRLVSTTTAKGNPYKTLEIVLDEVVDSAE